MRKFLHPAILAARIAAHDAVLERRRVYNRDYYRRNLGVPKVVRQKPQKPVVDGVHQVIRTFAPPLAGSIALSFFQHRGWL